jgi:hypothetical protein
MLERLDYERNRNIDVMESGSNFLSKSYSHKAIEVLAMERQQYLSREFRKVLNLSP